MILTHCTCSICGTPLSGALDTFGEVYHQLCQSCFLRESDPTTKKAKREKLLKQELELVKDDIEAWDEEIEELESKLDEIKSYRRDSQKRLKKKEFSDNLLLL